MLRRGGGMALRRLATKGRFGAQAGLVGGVIKVQARMFSVGDLNPFKKKGEPAAAQAPSVEEQNKQDIEDLKKIVDDDPAIYEEPELTFFEKIDTLWDTTLDYVSPFRWINKSLYGLHDLGFEWWMCIVLVSSGIRMVALPIQLLTSRNAIRMSKYQTEISVLKGQQQAALGNQTLTEKERSLVKNNFDMRLKALAQKGGYREWMSFLAIIAVIPFGLVFYCVRQLILNEPTITEGGCLWFKDLSAKDPTYILATMAFLMIAIGTEMNMSQSLPTKSNYYVMQRWGARVFAGFGLWMFSGNSAGILVGFVVSAFWGLIPPLLLRSAAFRRRFQIPSVQAAPRSNMEIKRTGWNNIKAQVQNWMAGASKDSSGVLGGGIGRIAHTHQGTVHNISDLKVARGKRKAKIDESITKI